MQRDPGAAVGGKTQVATAAGAVLRAKPGRINFMMALGDRQRLFGSNVHDELGTYHGTDGVRIHSRAGNDLIHGMRGDQLLDGRRGNDMIYGGGGDDRIMGGPGDDRIIDKQGRSIILTGPGRDSVDVADGDPDDRVICTPGAVDRVTADPGDECAAAGARPQAAQLLRRPNRFEATAATTTPTCRIAPTQTLTSAC